MEKRIIQFILWIAIGSSTIFGAKAVPDDYDILSLVRNNVMTDSLQIVDGADSYGAIKLVDDKIISIDLNKFSDQLDKLTTPFEIYALVTLDVDDSSCLFEIISNNENKLGLCFIPAGEDLMRITLSSSSLPEKTISLYHETKVNITWTKINLLIDMKNIELYVDCKLSDNVSIDTDRIVEDIYFGEDSILNFGKMTKEGNTFKGKIQNVKIFPKPDVYGRKDVCSDDFNLPASTKHNQSTKNDELRKAENYEINKFFDNGSSESKSEDIFSDTSGEKGALKGEKGDKGDNGDRGDNGDKGDKGDNGDKGENGDRGDKGDNGDKGDKGDNGAKGDYGDKGVNGVNGDKGNSGDKGDKGDRGDNGDKGVNGDKGDKGEKGDKGDLGEKGERGESVIGPEGPVGHTGAPGLQGPQGEKGSCNCSESVVSDLLLKMPEMKGPPGHIGLKGEKGEMGMRGNDGIPGNEGRNGTDGAPGSPGPVYKEIVETKVPAPGEKGDTGPVGPPGPPGKKGDKGDVVTRVVTYKYVGDPGKDGIPGINGTDGQPGKYGEKGVKGEKGDLGPMGLPAKLSSILDEDIDPIEEAAIFEKLKGDQGEIGTAGEKGEKGDIGLIGPTGRTGNNGVPGLLGQSGLKGQIGNNGSKGNKGDPGTPGPPGTVPLSQISLMKGPRGDRGSIGKTGPRGPTGHHGKIGPVGPRGKSYKGEPGKPGPVGPRGEKGQVGPKGEKGEGLSKSEIFKLKGDKGEMGEVGKSGETGKPGLPGTCEAYDKASVPGPAGPPGPPGSPGVSITGPKGEPGGLVTKSSFFAFNDIHHNSAGEDDDFYTTATVIFKTTAGLLKRTSDTPVGTLAYILQEKILLMRVENGWQYIVMGSFLHTRKSHTSTSIRPMYYSSTPSTPPSHRTPTYADDYIRLVALNQPYAGNIHMANNRTGRNAADQECYRQVYYHDLKGTFAAFLATRVEDLKYIVKRKRDRQVPVVNIYGDVLFDSWTSMFNGSGALLAKSSIYSFNRKNVQIDPTWPLKAVWHGSNSFGTVTPKAYCNEWSSDSPLLVGAASLLYSNRLLEPEQYTCDKKLIVLCVEVTSNSHSLRRHSHNMKSRARLHPESYDNRIPSL